MSNDDITIGWTHTEPSDMNNATLCKVTTELTFDHREVERIFHKLVNGAYVSCSQKGLQEKLKERAKRVEVEKVHYKAMMESYAGP